MNEMRIEPKQFAAQYYVKVDAFPQRVIVTKIESGHYVLVSDLETVNLFTQDPEFVFEEATAMVNAMIAGKLPGAYVSPTGN